MVQYKKPVSVSVSDSEVLNFLQANSYGIDVLLFQSMPGDILKQAYLILKKNRSTDSITNLMTRLAYSNAILSPKEQNGLTEK